MNVEIIATTCDRLKQAFNVSSLKQADLVRITGIDKSSISLYLSGKVTPKGDKLYKLALALNVSPVWLSGFDVPMRESDSPSDTAENIPGIYRIEKRRIPLLGNVACGEPTFAEEDAEIYIEANSTIDADFCLKAKGDSMTGARIFDGDIVFIRKQNMVNNGEIAVVLIGDETTLKRVQYDRESNEIALFAENPAYKTMRYKDAELDTVRILGKAIAFQSYLN